MGVRISVSGLIVVYHVPFAFQSIHGCSDETGENGDVKEGDEISVGGESAKIAWPLVWR